MEVLVYVHSSLCGSSWRACCKNSIERIQPNSMLHLLIWDEEEEDKYALKTKWARCPKKKSNCSRYTFGKIEHLKKWSSM